MENTKKLTGKDLINVGIYTAMTLVIFFVVGLLTALPVVYPFLFIIWPIVCGIPMMLYYTKIQKFGMLTITGIIGGIFFYLIGYGWIGLLGWVASDKKLLIFDEPTSGLDYRHMLEVSDNLNRLKEMGKSLFLITHDPELIYKCCTYLLFIQGSKVLWHRPMDGKAVELLRTFFSHEQETGAVNAS